MPKINVDTQSTIALFLVFAFVGVIVLLIFHPLPPDAGNTFTLIGVLGGLAGGVGTYYFGSSKGSASKDETINAIATKNVVDGGGAPPQHPYMTPQPNP